MSLWDTIGDIAGSLLSIGGSGSDTSGTAKGSSSQPLVQPPNLMSNTMTNTNNIQRPKVKAANESASQYVMDDPYKLAKDWSAAFKQDDSK
jgi:hypothetical protein